MVEIQVLDCQTQNEHDPAKVADAHHDVKEHVRHLPHGDVPIVADFARLPLFSDLKFGIVL